MEREIQKRGGEGRGEEGMRSNVKQRTEKRKTREKRKMDTPQSPNKDNFIIFPTSVAFEIQTFYQAHMLIMVIRINRKKK